LYIQQNFAQPNIKEAVRVFNMKEIIATVSSKGQVTVPAEVRKHLGIKEGDKLSFVIGDEGSVTVEAPRYRDVASLRGAAGRLEKPLDWKEILQIAREDHVREISESDADTNADTKTK
jgi:antitoxin PrlF